MNELPRLLDETVSEVERALLQAGRSYRSSRETSARTLAALGLAGSTAAVASTASATTLTSLAKLSGLKLWFAVSVVGAVAAVPIGYRILHGKAAAPRATVASAARTMEVSVPSVVGAVPAPLPGAATVAPSKPARTSVRVGGPSVRLGQELAALDAVRSTLAQGNGQGAMLLLDAYAQTCPHGRLELEAELLRMEALSTSGQSDAAARRATAFLRRHPTSVLAARARGYLGE